MFLNLPLICSFLKLGFAEVAIGAALSLFYIYFNVKPNAGGSAFGKLRMRVLAGGYECLWAVFALYAVEAVVYIAVAFLAKPGIGLPIALGNLAMFFSFLAVILINGTVRVFASSKQASLILRIAFVMLWWVPILNLILLKKFASTARKEYKFLESSSKRNIDRKHEQVCKTKYPLLMVHGIFFRDWKNFNYWGRIPDELEANGAVIFYGNQQSSASVESCAEELKACIEKIVEETGCEKVNIIAHSKGGLDSRYAVSALGMGKHVASLTTINTPHWGCNYARKLMELIPEKMVGALDHAYDALFSKLGDKSPDFLNGLVDLTDVECEKLNKELPDYPGVLCQSVGSKMASRFSSPFPLNLGYSIIKPLEGDNDGLVSVGSMEWGEFLGILAPKGKKGISHADMIDLTRKNVEGFDVSEFYVDLVQRLKKRGL
ncbi:MAG: triacylglycerol lipase [Clostridiales bacterium]|nr:triacylglycerol lipase [Clostridiales bacterium]